MGLNIDEILQSLEETKTAEAQFADGINENDTDIVEEKVAEATEAVEEKVAEATESVEEATETVDEEAIKTAEAEKVAEYDAQGRIIARAFMDELEKVAVGTGMYMAHSADATKGVNELPTGDIPEAGKAEAVIGQLKQMEAIGNSPSYIQVNGQAQPAPVKAPDETKGAIAADARPDMNQAIGGPAGMGAAPVDGAPAGEEKTAEADTTPEERILGNLYNSYFGEE
ncbi:hypothetical protein H8D85_01650 [bacterium]|nr:hypothetical protein [bacterium]